MFEEKDCSPMVKTILAQMSSGYGVEDIGSHHTLDNLGLKDDAAIAEIKTRIYRSLSGHKRRIEFNDFLAKTPVQLSSTVGEIVNLVMLSLPGDDPTVPR